PASGMGRASISARNPRVGPAPRRPSRTPMTPVVPPYPSCTAIPQERSSSATRAAVRCSWWPSSGCRWKSRRQACMACARPSSMRTPAEAAGAAWTPGTGSLAAMRSIRPVVGGFFGDLHVVDVRFAHPGGGDFHEFGLGVEILDGGAAAIAHGGPDAAHQLENDGNDAALVGDARLDAFGNQLVDVVVGILEIAVGRAVGHGAQAAH